MPKELSPYWQDSQTQQASEALFALTRTLKDKDPSLQQRLNSAIDALNANADQMVSAATAERETQASSFEAQKVTLRKELDGLKGDVTKLRGKVR